jgi:Fe-S-cluster-containing hydrogenase component 2
MGLIETGYLDYEELATKQKLPTAERYAKGAVAIAECVQEIPCNPCEASCPCHAICVGEPITRLPEIKYEQCTGCGMCAAKCPGLSIFVVNKAYSETTATVAFPYEYNPVPKVGDPVRAVNRKGKVQCDAIVVKVQNPASFDHTPLVTVEIPKEFADEVRSIERKCMA